MACMKDAWMWQVLNAGGFRLDGGGMFGIIPKSIWSRWTSSDKANRVDLNTNCLLLEKAGRRVLVESGCGDKWTEKERDIYQLERRSVVDALREIDVEPESIDTVVTTHLHFDHAGGLTTWDGRDPKEMVAEGISPRVVFPNAEIVVQRQEWDDALADRSTMTRTYLRTHLDPIADRVRLIDGAQEVLPGIRVRPLVGHTWGMQGIFIESAEGTVVFPGDLLPTVHHTHASSSPAYDMLPFETMQTKTAFLPEAVQEDWILVLDHEPDTPVGRISRTERGGYEVVPIT
jgi:glyoxylase-like metal-dependent hydrolase (beta-lactamase superfamily II)